MIYEQPAHQLGCHAKELRPVLQVVVILFHQPEEGFVYKGRWLKGMARALASHLMAGDAVQFTVNKGHQPVKRIASSQPNLGQQPGHLSASIRHILKPQILAAPICVCRLSHNFCPSFQVLARYIQDPRNENPAINDMDALFAGERSPAPKNIPTLPWANSTICPSLAVYAP
jgi:hypothetical protein